MVGKHSGGKKENGEVESLRGLHGPEQGMPKGPTGVYIDDMVVKSKVVSEHVKDLEIIFAILREHKLRLNASKCSFGVGSGKFLGYMVTHRGIEVSPDQIKAINSLQAPRNPKEVQKLTGMIAALNRFISRSAD